MIDIIDLDTNVGMKIKDAIADVAMTSGPEALGRLVQELVSSGVITADGLRRILPLRYEVRE